jgi:hypothetical protein
VRRRVLLGVSIGGWLGLQASCAGLIGIMDLPGLPDDGGAEDAADVREPEATPEDAGADARDARTEDVREADAPQEGRAEDAPAEAEDRGEG